MARRPEYLPWIAEALEEGAVVDWMQHVLDPQTGRVGCWYLPGSHSLNFLLENALGGGGVASLRIDPQGKAFAQQLLEFPVAKAAGARRRAGNAGQITTTRNDECGVPLQPPHGFIGVTRTMSYDSISDLACSTARPSSSPAAQRHRPLHRP